VVLNTKDKLGVLTERALDAGATGAMIIAARDIVVRDELADRCREPGCENYGKSKSCPPNVAGPSMFRRLLEAFTQAMLFKIDVPSDILFSSERLEVFRLLHTTAAGIERSAVELGFDEARAYAGGSCKELFCPDHHECLALSEKGSCRNPEQARPSMSGFGIDVASLFKTAGWTMNWVFDDNGPTKTKMANVCGLVLID
jgi:predicted metal-binding protein